VLGAVCDSRNLLLWMAWMQVANGVPAMGLCLYGFLTPGMVGALCFGMGLGISLFGVAYMFVHDGLVHRYAVLRPVWAN
jgi:beta-carotene 3-hydroxylase